MLSQGQRGPDLRVPASRIPAFLGAPPDPQDLRFMPPGPPRPLRPAIAKTTAVALRRLDQQAGANRPKDKGRKSLNSHARCLKVLDTRRPNARLADHPRRVDGWREWSTCSIDFAPRRIERFL